MIAPGDLIRPTNGTSTVLSNRLFDRRHRIIEDGSAPNKVSWVPADGVALAMALVPTERHKHPDDRGYAIMVLHDGVYGWSRASYFEALP